MPDDGDHSRSVYKILPDNVESHSYDKHGLVLVNHLGITDKSKLDDAENEGLDHAYRTLVSELTNETPLNSSFIKRAHKLIFENLFVWAGRWRTVNVAKENMR